MTAICPTCHGSGHVNKLANDWPSKYDPTFFPLYMKRTTCDMCLGCGKFRPHNETFTPLEDLPRPLLERIASLRPWLNLDAQTGTIHFIEGPGLPENNDNLLWMLKRVSQLGKELEETHNWLVSY